MRRTRQRGIALLVAIVMFAIATTVAAAITYSKAMAARRAAATFTLEQALQAGMAAEALAGIVLERTAATSADRDQPGLGAGAAAGRDGRHGRLDPGAARRHGRPLQPQQRGEVGRPGQDFVGDRHQIDVFRTLLEDLDIDQRYADLLVDWIDPGHRAHDSAGGEDTLYLSQVPPYRPPNTFITHTSELLALPGFGRENYRKIAPYVTALPNDETVNVCTASGIVLDATRNDPQNQSEFPCMDLEPAPRERMLSAEDRVFGRDHRSAAQELKSNPASRKNRPGSACAPTFVLALRSSFCTVSSFAKPPTECAPCSAVSEVNDR